MRIRFLELQNNDKKTRKLRLKELPESWKDIEQVFHYQSFFYIPKVICSKLINKYHNNLFIGHFGIEKLRELIAGKYYQPMLQRDIETYIKGCNVCFALKIVSHKLYKDLQSILVPIYWQKNMLMDFVTGLPISINQKNKSYNLILVIVN